MWLGVLFLPVTALAQGTAFAYQGRLSANPVFTGHPSFNSSGGTTVYSDEGQTSGVNLAPGGSSWAGAT